MRIGVLSDTHIPDRTRGLPDEIFDLFAGVDLILHAGDISEAAVLDRLATVAPVYAVRGNRDDTLADVPRRRIVNAGAFRIGLIHGQRPRPQENPDRMRYMRGDHRFLDQRAYVLQAFADDRVDCVVFGHSHQACQDMHDGVLLLNPGGVFRSPGGDPSSVAILELDRAGIRPRLIALRFPPPPYTLLEEMRRALFPARGFRHK